MKKSLLFGNRGQRPADQDELPDPSRRLVLLLGGAVASAGALGWRLFDWHVNQSADLAARGSSVLLTRTEINPRRGTILDRTGDVLAISRGALRVVADPQAIYQQADPFAVADRLGGALQLDPLGIADRIADPRAKYALVARGVFGTQEETLRRLIEQGALPGIRLEPDRVRVYPNQELGAHVLGFVGESAERVGEIVGQAGVEAWYDDALRGEPGQVSADLDRLGRRIPTGRYASIPARHGSHLVLTIDRTIQYIAEQELEVALERYGAEAGTILILNPSGGELLALASRPTYNPMRVHEYQRLGPEFANRTTGLIHEPGSTFKLITMAAGLDCGAITPQTTHNLPGVYRYYGQEFRNWDEKTYPDQNMTEVLIHSSNTGAIFVADRIGANRFYDYVERFGFGSPTGIDVAGEVGGIVRRRGDQGWFLPDLAANSFGQGISVTPIQLATAIGAIANGGVMMRPHVARAIVRPDGRQETIQPQSVRRVISSQTCQTLIQMIETAESSLPENLALIPGYRTAGKTGTAEVPSGGRILPDISIASYVGFGPLEAPQVLALVTIEKPQTGFWGSQVASPTFQRVMRRVFAHLKIPPRDGV